MALYSDRRVLGHFNIGATRSLSRADIDAWSRENLERFTYQYRQDNPWSRDGNFEIECRDTYGYSLDCELVWYPRSSQRELSLASSLPRPPYELQLQMSQQQAEMARVADQARALAQAATYRPLYGGMPAAVAEISQTMAKATERKAEKVVKPFSLKFKVWVVSLLSGDSPFKVYRQLIKREESE